MGLGEGTDYHCGEVPTRVLVVENHRLVRQGIRSELSGHGGFVVTEATTGLDAIAAATAQRPDVVVLDFELPDRPGSEICAAILDRHPSAVVVVISEHEDEASVRAALDSGARAYLLRNSDDLDLPYAIERALAGESVIDPRATAALLPSRGPQQAKLSSQELKVLRLVAEGLTNPEIGTRLYLSRHTVKEYVSHAMHKLEATNRIEAVRKATALGLIEGVGPPSGDTTRSGRETLVYNDADGPARNADLKTTPLKIDRLVAGEEQPAE